MSNTKFQQYKDYEEVLDAIPVLPLAIILLIITGFHSRNVYHDMFTSQRKTLEYRAHKPKMTTSYKAVVYTTLLAIISFAWTLLFAAIQYNFSITSCHMAFMVCEKIGFFTSRGALYLTYIIRVHRTYGTSGFGWKVRNLELIAAIIIVVTVGLFLFTTVTFIYHPVYIDDTDNTFPYYCQIISDEPYAAIAGGGILLFDLVCSICSMIAFIMPLNKIRHAMEENNPKAYTENAKKMRAVGYQYKVLVIVGSTTTLLWILLLFLQQTSLATLFINLDYLFNCVVICFMSSYYPRDKYYERFCFLCICMCGRHREGKTKKGYRSHASKRNLNVEASAALTADTSTMFAHSRLHALIYADVDANKDNRIDAQELAEACDISVEEAQNIIDEHDVDGDGKLDIDEFERLQQQILDKKEKEKEEKKTETVIALQMGRAESISEVP